MKNGLNEFLAQKVWVEPKKHLSPDWLHSYGAWPSQALLQRRRLPNGSFRIGDDTTAKSLWAVQC
jgi:hypothetical protein